MKDTKDYKMLAEKALFEAASRYFEEPDIIAEKVVTDENGVKYNIPDNMLSKVGLTPTELAKTVTGDEGAGDPDALQAVSQYDVDPSAAAAAVHAADRASAKEKDAARFATNTSGENTTFAGLLPQIEELIKGATAIGLDTGAITPTSAGTWKIDKVFLHNTQDGIFKKVIRPIIAAAVKGNNADKAKARAVRDAWEQFIGWRGSKKDGEFLLPIQVKMQKYADAQNAEVTESVDCEFNKTFCKFVNEKLTAMYAERYGVELDEAAKMFVVDDKEFLED